MRLHLPSGQAHLTYCANVHRGESWAETFAALRRHLPEVKRQVSPAAPMGVGLRLSAEAAAALAEPAALDTLRGSLAEQALYVFTINGFPYGRFHGVPVKEQVYAPDWRRPERLAYTDRLAGLLAALLPADRSVTGSISTVPGAFRAAGAEPGARIAIANALLRRHLGLCLDVCHAAVEFEPPAESLALLRRAGIAVARLQLSSALAVRRPDAEAAALLRRFDDGIYLHQVVQRRPDGSLRRPLDLPEALATLPADPAGHEWRVHCHVPVFHEHLGRLGTTQFVLRDVLVHQREEGISPHLEVETYTWDVLPPELRRDGLDAAIARELSWVRERLLP